MIPIYRLIFSQSKRISYVQRSELGTQSFILQKPHTLACKGFTFIFIIFDYVNGYFSRYIPTDTGFIYKIIKWMSQMSLDQLSNCSSQHKHVNHRRWNLKALMRAARATWWWCAATRRPRCSASTATSAPPSASCCACWPTPRSSSTATGETTSITKNLFYYY